jgi:hypothetical protein
MSEVYSKVQKVITDIKFMNLATITEVGKPWNTPLYFAFDKDMNIYWMSWHKNIHSINISKNPDSFITIYDSTVVPNTGKAFGVYFEGKTKQLKNVKEMLVAIKLLYSRGKINAKDIMYFMKKFPQRLYKFTPEKCWVNGTDNQNEKRVDVRREVDLIELIKTLMIKHGS